MDVLEFLTSVVALAAGPLLVVVPLLLYRWVTDTAAECAPYGPVRVDNATLAGLILGVCLVVVAPLPGKPLTFDSVFNVGGPWDMGLGPFGWLVLDQLSTAPALLVERLALDDERLNLTLGVAFALGLLLARAVLDAVNHGWRLSLTEVAMDAAIAALTAMLTLYTALLVLWLCNRLNFWLFGVAILLIQERRYGVFGLFPRHRHFRLPRARLPLEAPVRPKPRHR